MEVSESKLDGSDRGDLEASLHEADSPQLSHSEVLREEQLIRINEEISGANNAPLDADSVAIIPVKQELTIPSKRNDSSSSSSSSSSETSPKDRIEGISGNEFTSYNVPKEHDTQLEWKDDGEHTNRTLDPTDVAHDTFALEIPAIQSMEKNEEYNPDRIPGSIFGISNTSTPVEWSTISDESLFSIHPKTYSYGGDQAFLFEAEMQKEEDLRKPEDLTPNPPQVSAEPGDNENIGKERTSEEKEVSQSQDEKKQPDERAISLHQDEPKPPNAALLYINPSLHSEGSEGSEYSFAFPILVPGGGLQSNSTKGDIHKSRRRQPMGHHLDAECSVTRPTPPSPHRRTRCCCCCFSCCSIDSCCTRQSWKTCCELKYWLSFYTDFFCCTHPSCHSCNSCCTRLSCPCCKKFPCLSCWPCR